MAPAGHADALLRFEQGHKRRHAAFVASLACHATAVLLLAATFRHHPSSGPIMAASQHPYDLVWLTESGPGGGGGGGGNRRPEFPRRAEMPGKDQTTLPVSKSDESLGIENPLQQLDIPSKSFAAAIESVPGVIEGLPGLAISLGSGRDEGAGIGHGAGIGPGNGPGLGPGQDGGTGEDVYRPGHGVTAPIVRHRETPQYTRDAVSARIQGSVIVDCIVQVSGICSDIRVVRSLDRMFGLDAEAIRAARLWRFLPGTRMGRPVPVLVTIEIAFSIH